MRLLVVTSAALLVEGLFFTALAPLLPGFQRHLGLSKFGLGLLSAMYPLGIVLGAIPTAITSARVGVRRTMVAGLVTVAAMNLAFGFAQSLHMLFVAQFVGGIGGAAVWSGALVWLLRSSAQGERGRTIGWAQGSTALGEILGPVVGGLAATVGRAVAFGGAGLFTAVLAMNALRLRVPPSAEERFDLRDAIGSAELRYAAILSSVPGLMLGALILLATLQLDGLGASAGAIAVVFLVSACVTASVSPLVGHWADRCGRLPPIRVGLLATTSLLVALALTDSIWPAVVAVIAVLAALRAYWGPALALLSDACDQADIGQVWGFALALLTGTIGMIVGSTVSGAVADAAGVGWAYCLVAVLAAVAAALAFWMRAPLADVDSACPADDQHRGYEHIESVVTRRSRQPQPDLR